MTAAYGGINFYVYWRYGRITYWFMNFKDHFYLAWLSIFLICAMAIGFYEALVRL